MLSHANQNATFAVNELILRSMPPNNALNINQHAYVNIRTPINQ